MTSELSQIFIATFMVAVTVTVFAWFRRGETAASARRMMGMMSRMGLDPAFAAPGDARTRAAMMVETRRRCRGCPREDYCERWLAGEIEESIAFCPNAPTLRALQEGVARAD
jgi:hypothetical protein